MTLAEQIFASLDANFQGDLGKDFERYLREHNTGRWLIFSDYVLGDKSRPNDVYAFSIIPGGEYLDSFWDLAKSTNGGDLKDKKSVEEPMLKMLSDPRLFTFCFLVRRPGIVPKDRKKIAIALEETVATMLRWENAGSVRPMISKFKALANRAKSQAFNRVVIDQVMTAAALAATITFAICKTGGVERVGWFSDRDRITTAFDGVASDIYSIHVNDLCRKFMNDWPGPALGVNAPSENGSALWCDLLLRIPDHFAGTISAWDVEANTLASPLPKYEQILLEAVADKPSVQLLRLHATSAGESLIISCSRILCSRTPIADQKSETSPESPTLTN